MNTTETPAKFDKNSLKWTPSLGDAIDRLSITILKELLIPGQKQRYAKEVEDLVHDIDILAGQSVGKLLKDFAILVIMNDRIWVNESNYRNGITAGNALELTHGLNSVRCLARAKVQGDLDKDAPREFKADTVMPPDNWIPSGYPRTKTD